MQRIAEQVQKLVTTERILKGDSPKDNILSETAAKKIHEAGNCELHEVQQKLTKYNVSVAIHTLRPMRRTIEHIFRNALQHKTKN